MRGFSEIINVDRNDLFFSFVPSNRKEEESYSVTVALSGSSSIHFEMERSPCGRWHFRQHAPQWIVGLQEELARAINANP